MYNHIIRLCLATLCLCFILENANAQFDAQLHHIAVSPGAELRNLSAHDLDGDGDPDALATYTAGVFWFENDGKGNFSNGKLLLDTDLDNQFFTDYAAYPALVADLDNDGLPDVTAGSYWMKNLGGGRFANPESAWWQRVSALCDVNADGLADIVSAYNNNNIVWQRNLGLGTFATQAGVSNATGPRIFASGDMNRDGWEDLVVRKNSRLYWFNNLKINDFSEIEIASTAPLALASGDVDGNGRHDLLLGFASEIRWLECSYTGQWTLRQSLAVTNGGNCLELADMDNDGDNDLFVGQSGGVSLRFLLESNGLFATVPDILSNPGTTFQMAAPADFDGDGKMDLLLGQFTSSNQPRLVRDVAAGLPAFNAAPVLLGQPFGYFHQMFPADLDADGDEDLLAANFLFEKIAPGKFADRGKINVPHIDLQLADLDGDGLPDAVFPKNDAVYWQRNLGNLAFGPEIELDGFVAQNRDVGIADFDGDGDLDLCAANGTEALTAFELVIWFENDGAGNFTKHHVEDDISWCTGIAPLDVDTDGLPDLVLQIGNLKPDIWFRNLGGGTFGPQQPFFAPGTTEPALVNQKMLVDLNADGKTDLVFIDDDYHETELYWYQNLGGGAFSDKKSLNFVDHLGSYSAPFFTVFDADGDGLTDVVRTDAYHGRVLFLRGLGSGDFAPAAVLYDDSRLRNFMAIAPHDVDGDGQRDLVFGEKDPGVNSNDGIHWLAAKDIAPPSVPDCPAEIWYTAQSEIDSFIKRYPNCRHLVGNLVLRETPGNNLPTITNLEGFRQLKTISGGVFIWGHHLQNLRGLDSLASIGTHLEILNGIGGLTSLEGLEKLTHTGGTIEIGNNKTSEFSTQPALKTMQGLENLQRVGGHFRLLQQGVKSLSGLVGLDFVGKDFIIHSDSLRNLQGLENLDTVGNVLILSDLKRLQSLDGLQNLRHAGLHISTDSLRNLQGLAGWQSGRALVLTNNKLLESLSGIENLQRLNGQNTALPVLKDPAIRISGNPKLADLSGMDHPVTIAPDGLFISQNPLLGDCAAQAICDLLPASPDTVFISQNGVGCNSKIDISIACGSAVPTATLSGNTEICAGDSTELTISFSGEGPYTFVLAVDGVPQPPATTSNNPHKVLVAPVSFALYTLRNVSNVHGSGLVSGAAVVSVAPLPIPLIAGPDTICLGDTIMLTAAGGTGFQWNTGGQTAQIEVQPDATTTYTVTVSDANACTAATAWTVVAEDCTSGTFSGSSDAGFQVFPNPLFEGGSLQIMLENGFLGTIKIEILGLDGRMMQTVFEEKTRRTSSWAFRVSESWPGAFMVRVSDGSNTATRLVYKF